MWKARSEAAAEVERSRWWWWWCIIRMYIHTGHPKSNGCSADFQLLGMGILPAVQHRSSSYTFGSRMAFPFPDCVLYIHSLFSSNGRNDFPARIIRSVDVATKNPSCLLSTVELYERLVDDALIHYDRKANPPKGVHESSACHGFHSR